MEKYKAGFVGSGNMGFALATAAAYAVGGDEVILSASCAENAEKRAKKLSCHAGTACEAAERAKFVFLAVKPNKLSEVAKEILPGLGKNGDAVIVSMLAGVSLKTLEDTFGAGKKLIRIMPNTPVSVGSGLTLMCTSDGVTEAEKAQFLALMAKSGALEELPEGLMDAASALSGCGPAFVYRFAEALSSGALFCGLPKKKADYYALLTLKGACEYALSSDKHLAELTDEVCSPGGSTIAGVKAMEEGGFSSAAMNAVIKACEKTKELGRK